MTLWEAVFCLCRRDNHAVHPVSVAHESVPVANNPAPVVEQPIPQTPVAAPVENGDVPIMDEATKVNDAAQNLESQPEQLDTLAPAEEVQTSELPVGAVEEKKDEEKPNDHLTVSPKSIEEHQANEEEAKVPEDLQPEVKRLSIDTLASTKTFDPVVETLEKAAWIVQSLSQERGSIEEHNQEKHVAAVEADASKEEITDSENHEQSLETIKEGEPLPIEKVRSARIELNGSTGKWEPNDTKAPPKQKIIKVKATAVRENKKPMSTRSIDHRKANNVSQVRFQPPRRNSVPAKKEPKKMTIKKVEESEESQGEVVLVSPTEHNQLVNNVHDTSAETSASVGTEIAPNRPDEEELCSKEASNN